MPKVALLHYSAPPIIGGVESVIEHHARLLINAGHEVRMVAARGGPPCDQAEYFHFPLVGSQHEAILAIKKHLDVGHIPAEFETNSFSDF